MYGRVLAFLVVSSGVAACGSPGGGHVPGRGGAAVAPGGLAEAAATHATPVLRLPDDFAPTGYRARLVVDPANPTFSGVIAIDGELARDTSLVWLNAEALTFAKAEVEIGGERRPLEIVPRDHHVVGLRAPGGLRAGALTLHLDYTGTLNADDTEGAFVQTVDGAPYVFTQFEPLGARRVFPTVDEPSSKVPWQLTLDVPDGVVALGNTPVAREEALPGGGRRVELAPTRPLPTYLVAFAVGPFELVDAGATAGGAPIRIATFRGRAAHAAWAAEVTPKVVAILEEWFGTPYPYEKLDSVPIPSTIGFGAMENAGLITYREDLLLLDPKSATDDDRRDYAWVAAHEVAHQWFGNLVTLAWWDDIWLNEAFASWMEDKVMARFSPAWSLRVPLATSRNGALGADGLLTARRIREPIASNDDIETAFDGITYDKGRAVIRMVEAWVGEDAFRDGVRRYLDRHAWGNATSADFLAAIDEASPEDVTAAFQAFLDQPGAPRVEASLRCDKKQPPVVTLTQARWLPRGATPPADDARWTIPVCVAYGTVKTRAQACTVLRDATAELTLDGKCPAWVFPNADALGYFRVGLAAGALDDLLAKGWSQLRPHERIALADDVRAAVDRGELPLEAELALVPLLLLDGSRFAVDVAAEIAWDARRVVGDDARPALAAWVRDTFGARARKLGLLPGKKETLDQAQIRELVVPLVTEVGEDAELLDRAVELARKRDALPHSVRALVLRAAARRDASTRAELFAAMTTSRDLREQRDLAAGLGGIADPDAAGVALALLLDPAIDLKPALWLIFDLADEPRTQAAAEAFLREHADALLARWPEGTRARLIRVLTASCDPARRDAAAAWAKEHLEGKVGAPRVIAQALEAMDQCIARKAALGPELDAWLANRPRP